MGHHGSGPTGDAFHGWEHVRCPKRKGGKVFLAVGARGDVAVHEGYVSSKEARKREKLTIAEFVSDAGSMTVLFSIGVDLVQGNFLAPPSAAMNYEFG